MLTGSNLPTTEVTDMNSLLETAIAAALEAGKAILEVYDSGEFGATQKADTSPLTLADEAAHQVITQHLLTTSLPILSEEGNHGSFESRKNWQKYWLVDPLDGTKEFLKRNGEFTVNIALMQQNLPIGGVVYAPVLNTLYYGSKETGTYKKEREKRSRLEPLSDKASLESLLERSEVKVIASRSHLTTETENFVRQFQKTHFVAMGSSLKFMLLAEGKADIYPRFAPTMEWDTAAAHAILKSLNRGIYQEDLETELQYNKPDLLNPSFVAL